MLIGYVAFRRLSQSSTRDPDMRLMCAARYFALFARLRRYIATRLALLNPRRRLPPSLFKARRQSRGHRAVSEGAAPRALRRARPGLACAGARAPGGVGRAPPGRQREGLVGAPPARARQPRAVDRGPPLRGRHRPGARFRLLTPTVGPARPRAKTRRAGPTRHGHPGAATAASRGGKKPGRTP